MAQFGNGCRDILITLRRVLDLEKEEFTWPDEHQLILKENLALCSQLLSIK
jgi:hypothetical protein